MASTHDFGFTLESYVRHGSYTDLPGRPWPEPSTLAPLVDEVEGTAAQILGKDQGPWTIEFVFDADGRFVADQVAFHPEGAGLDPDEDREPIEALFPWADLDRGIAAERIASIPVTEQYGSGDAEGETILCLANGVNLHYQGDGRRATLRLIRGRHGSEADRALIRRVHPRLG